MQVFLPHPSYIQSAQVLDNLRLQKQRVEAFQIYNASQRTRFRTDGTIIGPTTGWIRHPAVRMWQNYPHQLCVYALAICRECNARNIRDVAGVEDFFFSRLHRHADIIPDWIANEDVLNKVTFSHRCNLVRKDMKFYAPKFPDVNVVSALMTDYHWPV